MPPRRSNRTAKVDRTAPSSTFVQPDSDVVKGSSSSSSSATTISIAPTTSTTSKASTPKASSSKASTSKARVPQLKATAVNIKTDTSSNLPSGSQRNQLSPTTSSVTECSDGLESTQFCKLWDGRQWWSIYSDGERVPDWRLQNAGYQIPCQFANLLTGADVLDFTGEFHWAGLACPSKQLTIGRVNYLRIKAVPSRPHIRPRDPLRLADAGWTIKSNAQTIVLLCSESQQVPDLDTFTVAKRRGIPAKKLKTIKPRYLGDFLAGSQRYYELAVEPIARARRVVLHLGRNMAPPEAYDIAGNADELVLVVNDLRTVAPRLLADLLTWALIPVAWFHQNNSSAEDFDADNWHPVAGCDMRGRVPHITIVGFSPISHKHSAALSQRFHTPSQPTLASFIESFGAQTYGVDELKARCEIIGRNDYAAKIGVKAFNYEMGE
ncbi:hypothetical protein CC85DRAFT_150584 [Cutaneotrichosporon oleaginosum]|uniref:Uncharacterized protein n=1 Tax=Cutaneotrichosporon oleaginosum TaxID=879819 RepID=A0A0J1AYG6_9TREE|nr:uncharacterized protein CC85DRAFT_150584 [Cutaneotrichosporon oleaginosum]KLT40374.1 hypothetical protein CC85DRAFT_150584 [Cutaneotrichosporon oleaginosum]TXT11341.1 hypothetical protein COLE_01751 [Cutaneotrichosporon oleaginosum]